MTYLCSQEILAAHQTASFVIVCVLILEHPQAHSRAQEMHGKKCKRLLAILQNQHSAKPDYKAKNFRFHMTTWEGALPGSHGFLLPAERWRLF